MAYKIIRFIVLALCHAKHALADLRDVAQLGKAMSKAFVPTGHMPSPSGSMFVRPAATGTPDHDEVVTGSRFPLHEAPSNNQLGSILHVGEPVSKQNEELKEYYQHVRSRMQPMPQADAKDAQYGFGFGCVIGLMVSVGLLASIGIAAFRKYLNQGQQTVKR